jgi:hypothetical protein
MVRSTEMRILPLLPLLLMRAIWFAGGEAKAHVKFVVTQTQDNTVVTAMNLETGAVLEELTIPGTFKSLTEAVPFRDGVMQVLTQHGPDVVTATINRARRDLATTRRFEGREFTAAPQYFHCADPAGCVFKNVTIPESTVLSIVPLENAIAAEIIAEDGTLAIAWGPISLRGTHVRSDIVPSVQQFVVETKDGDDTVVTGFDVVSGATVFGPRTVPGEFATQVPPPSTKTCCCVRCVDSGSVRTTEIIVNQNVDCNQRCRDSVIPGVGPAQRGFEGDCASQKNAIGGFLRAVCRVCQDVTLATTLQFNKPCANVTAADIQTEGERSCGKAAPIPGLPPLPIICTGTCDPPKRCTLTSTQVTAGTCTDLQGPDLAGRSQVPISVVCKCACE